MQFPSHVSVAVVGAGPAGLTAACMLRQNGVNIIVLDANAQPSKAPRATIIHSRTMEVLEQIELTERIIRQGNKLTKWNIRDGKSILVTLDFTSLKSKFPMVITLPQSETEALLEYRLKELGGEIIRNARVTGITDEGNRVRLQVHSETAELETTTVNADYVIAADGLRSMIRTSLDIPFEGGEYNASFVTADCRFSSHGSLEKDSIQLFLAPQGFLLFVPEPHDIWRMVATLDVAPANADVAFYQRLADERAVPGIIVKELTWSSCFHIHHRLAQHWRKDRIFLAGDAAHVHSPAGGQGMNIGIQDGARLGQILSEALNDGRTADVDLDRYEAERRPIARGVVALTHRTTTMATLKSPWLGYLRNWFIWGIMSSSWMRAWLTTTLAELEH